MRVIRPVFGLLSASLTQDKTEDISVEMQPSAVEIIRRYCQRS